MYSQGCRGSNPLSGTDTWVDTQEATSRWSRSARFDLREKHVRLLGSSDQIEFLTPPIRPVSLPTLHFLQVSAVEKRRISIGLPPETQFNETHFGHGFGLLIIGEGRSNRRIDSRGRLIITLSEVHFLDSPSVLVAINSQSGLLILIAPRILTNLQLHTAFIEGLGGWIHE